MRSLQVWPQFFAIGEASEFPSIRIDNQVGTMVFEGDPVMASLYARFYNVWTLGPPSVTCRMTTAQPTVEELARTARVSLLRRWRSKRRRTCMFTLT